MRNHPTAAEITKADAAASSIRAIIFSSAHSFVISFSLSGLTGAIGFVDDYAKIRKHDNTGLTAGWKFLLQLAAAIAFLTLLNSTHHLSPNLYIPFVNISRPLPWGVYLVFAAFVIVGCVNSVNL